MEEEEEVLQLLDKNLSLFGKRNKQRFHILEDLSLTCDMCKTQEAKNDIRTMTRRYFDELRREQSSLNGQIQNMLKKSKSMKKSGPSKDFEKRAMKMIDRFTSIHIGRGRLKLKVKSIKKLPQLEFELKF